MMIRSSLALSILFFAVGAVFAAEPKAAEPYEGFKADQALLRKQFVHPDRDGMKGAKASSGEACDAAMRIFSRVSFLFRTRAEVLELLGDPATISDYNRPADKDPMKPLSYTFDSGFGGLRYVLEFEQGKVFAVRVESQN